MKKWTTSIIKRIRKQNKGETLVESIVSLAILSILFTTIAMIIITAMRMIGSSAETSRRLQEDFVNPAVWSGYAGTGEGALIEFSAAGILAQHNVVLNNDFYNDTDAITAFTPALPAEPPEEP